MSGTPSSALSYYAQPGPLTGLGPYAPLAASLPCDIPALVSIVQGLMLHVFWAERHGVELSDERKAEVQIRPVDRKLERLLELDGRPLDLTRPLEQRLVGNCRDFSILLCAFLRYHGIPARARCGFGAYFLPNHYEDHWVCEYWNAAQSRWVMVDAQLDALQCQVLQPPFDPFDVPHDQFLTGGHAWQICRRGEANPDDFGIFDMHGLWFIRGDLIRDFLSLNKLEILPWDHWGLMSKPDEDINPAEMELLDRMAALTQAGNESFLEVLALYAERTDLRPPQDWIP